MQSPIALKFGKYATKRIDQNPAAARRLLAGVFRAYGTAARLSRSNGELPARNELMWRCNRMMARSLTAKKDTAAVSIFTPCQQLHAMGIEPLFPEGLSCYMTAAACEEPFLNEAEASGVPESFCSYHKEFIGIARKGILQRPSCIVNTTMVCDANQLSFRFLADYFDVPHFLIDVPNNDNEKNRAYVAGQLRDLTGFLEKHTGRRMDMDRFREVMVRSRDSMRDFRRIMALKADRHETTKMTSHMLDAFAMHVMLGTEDTSLYTAKMVRNLEELPPKRAGVRLLWVHALPYWQTSLGSLFNYNDRVEILSCDMVFDHLDTELDPDRPYESLAEMLLADSFNGPAERRLNAVLRYAREMHADGIIYFSHWGCKQTMGISVLAKKIFEEAGFPTLTLDGDGCDTRNIQVGQMVTRASAFLEQLEAAQTEKGAVR